jgi:membrane protease YdiL (CAAX protease family)
MEIGQAELQRNMSPAHPHIPPGPVAPWWHTLLFIALLLGTSFAGAVTTRALKGHETHRVLNYSLTIAWEWLLAAFVWWGLRLRRVSLRSVLGTRRPGAANWLADAIIALLFWLCAMLALGLVALLLKPLHVDANSVRTIVSRLGPATPAQMAAWLGMSLTAGVVEEFLFRGYLQRQFASWSRRLWVGILASALLFGIGHGYEGLAGMLLISAYGAMFSGLAVQRRSLRAGMMAHAWHDAVSGLALFLMAHGALQHAARIAHHAHP